jgi:hypothetical protein
MLKFVTHFKRNTTFHTVKKNDSWEIQRKWQSSGFDFSVCMGELIMPIIIFNFDH